MRMYKTRFVLKERDKRIQRQGDTYLQPTVQTAQENTAYGTERGSTCDERLAFGESWVKNILEIFILFLATFL